MVEDRRQPREAGSSPDWEAIERDYRAGVLSTREIGALHGVSHTAINKRAKGTATSPPWTRDLSAKIKAKAEALVSRAAVSSEVSAQQLATERQVVDANANQIAKIRQEHRTDIQRSKRITNRLLEALERLGITEVPSMAFAPAQAPGSASESNPQLSVALKEHTQMLRTLVESQRALVSMEREAYGIAQMVPAPDDESGKPVEQLEAARRLAFALSRAGHAHDRPKEA